jgi:hypothetical protein
MGTVFTLMQRVANIRVDCVSPAWSKGVRGREGRSGVEVVEV